jgi:hypothetical protein
MYIMRLKRAKFRVGRITNPPPSITYLQMDQAMEQANTRNCFITDKLQALEELFGASK